MNLLHVLILAIIQGITEFLPVSSSAHLIFFPRLLGWKDPGLAFDVAVHFGTLLAVVIYFWRDFVSMIRGGFKLLKGQPNQDATLALYLCVATLPALLVGYLISSLTQNGIRNLTLMGSACILFGVLLYVADRHSSTRHTAKEMSYLQAFFVGLMQVCAFIPGASRSGSCLIALRLLGLKRTEAVRLSCLLSVPVILAATVLMGYKLYKVSDVQMYWDSVLAIVFSCFAGLLSISFMMHWVEKTNFSIFAGYRILLGGALLSWAYFA